MSDEASRQTGLPTKPPTPAEIEIQRHVNELRREVLDGREAHIKRWIAIIITGFTSLGIVAGVIGYIEITQLQETKLTIREIQDDAIKIKATLEKNDRVVIDFETKAKKYSERFANMENAAKRSAESAADRAEKFDKWLSDIETKRKKSALIRSINAQTADDDLKKAETERTIVNVYENLEASTTDKAIARALSLQQRDKIDNAIGEWQDVAYIAGKSDDKVLAASAQFSIGYLQNKKKNLEEAISSYEKAILLKPDFPEAHKNLEAAKAELQQNADY